jgi:hypothetical protein
VDDILTSAGDIKVSEQRRHEEKKYPFTFSEFSFLIAYCRFVGVKKTVILSEQTLNSHSFQKHMDESYQNVMEITMDILKQIGKSLFFLFFGRVFAVTLLKASFIS